MRMANAWASQLIGKPQAERTDLVNVLLDHGIVEELQPKNVVLEKVYIC